MNARFFFPSFFVDFGLDISSGVELVLDFKWFLQSGVGNSAKFYHELAVFLCWLGRRL